MHNTYEFNEILLCFILNVEEIDYIIDLRDTICKLFGTEFDYYIEEVTDMEIEVLYKSEDRHDLVTIDRNTLTWII